MGREVGVWLKRETKSAEGNRCFHITLGKNEDQF